MGIIEADFGDLRRHDSLIEDAARSGFSLECYTTPSGRRVWEWRRGDEPRPQFVTERVALHWMCEWLRATRD